MATDTVYVDGTLVSGANDGTSWTDAYRGNAGLQAAFDNIDSSNTTNMYVRNTFTLFTTIDVDTAGGDEDNNIWCNVIGCDTAGVELADWIYTTWMATPNEICALLTNVNNIRFEHIYFQGDSTGNVAFQWVPTLTSCNAKLPAVAISVTLTVPSTV